MNKSELNNIKWGDIYICNLGNSKGSVQRGLRPVIVLQTNGLNTNSPTITVAAISSSIKRQNIKTHILLDSSCGLSKPSMVVLEQIRTIDKAEELIEYVGCVKNKETRLNIKNGLRYAFSLAPKAKPKRKGIILNLCSNCQKDYFKAPDTMIRRLDPFQREKALCEKCHKDYGYDYLILRRQRYSKQCIGGDCSVR